jgi:CrcB protein
MTHLLWVALGAGLGAPARYLIDQLISSRRERVLPWGTLFINTSGSFCLGLLAGLAQHHGVDRDLMLMTSTGFLGAYTTFSTFTWETMRLAEDGAVAAALGNVAVSVVAGMTAAACGLLLGAV